MDVLGAENSVRTDSRPASAAPDGHLGHEVDDLCPLCALLEIREVMRELRPLLIAIRSSPTVRRWVL